MKKELKKEDVRCGQFFILSPSKGYGKSASNTAMQVIECHDEYMMVKTKDGVLTKDYDQFELVSDIYKFNDVECSSSFTDNRTGSEFKIKNSGGIPINI